MTTWLVTDYGKPFSPDGLATAFGMRKAAATRDADNGATVPQLMGEIRLTMKAAELYARKANRRRLGTQIAARATRNVS